MTSEEETQLIDENADVVEEISSHEHAEREEYAAPNEAEIQMTENLDAKTDRGNGRGGFVHGLSTGLGIGCIATFVIMWITVFFTPQLPTTITYESMLAIFIYPLVYLLAVGLVALTAGIVREYYANRPQN